MPVIYVDADACPVKAETEQDGKILRCGGRDDAI